MRSSFSPGGADATINTLEEKIVGSPTRTAHPTSQEKVRPWVFAYTSLCASTSQEINLRMLHKSCFLPGPAHSFPNVMHVSVRVPIAFPLRSAQNAAKRATESAKFPSKWPWQLAAGTVRSFVFQTVYKIEQRSFKTRRGDWFLRNRQSQSPSSHLLSN